MLQKSSIERASGNFLGLSVFNKIDVFSIQTIDDSFCIMRRSFVGPKDVIAIRMVFFNKRNDSLVDTFLQVHQTIDYQTGRNKKMLAIPWREKHALTSNLDWNLSFWRYFTFDGVSFMLLESLHT